MGALFCSDRYISEKKMYTTKLAMVPRKDMTPVKTKNWASDEKSPGGYIRKALGPPQVTLTGGS